MVDNPDWQIMEIRLPSCTVFAREVPGIQTDLQLMDAEQWLAENCKSDWRVWREGVWFADGRDAMLFKLVWGG